MGAGVREMLKTKPSAKRLGSEEKKIYDPAI